MIKTVEFTMDIAMEFTMVFIWISYNIYSIYFYLKTLYLKAYSDFKILDNYLILPYKII